MKQTWHIIMTTLSILLCVVMIIVFVDVVLWSFHDGYIGDITSWRVSP